MELGGGVVRGRDDACPGALRPHHAADGELLRLRVPGGALAGAALGALAIASAELGDGRVGLTSRGNLQIRGVDADHVADLGERVRAAGLLPDGAHERVRNIIASPMSGRRDTSLADVDALVDELDAALCARPALAGLPGRFLFAVDDGSGDVVGEQADVLARAIGPGRFGPGRFDTGRFVVGLGGAGHGVEVETAEVVTTVLALAEGFLAEREAQGSSAWRVRELTDGPARLVARLGGRPVEGSLGAPGRHLEPGLVDQVDGRFGVCAGVPLGLLNQEQIAAVVAVTELAPGGSLRITPWRRIVVRDCDLPAALAVRELLAAVGLIVEPGSAWARLTACAGRPGCAKSLTDVHADVTAFAAACEPEGPAVHWVGCSRGCGTPAGDVVQIVANPHGYDVRGSLEAHENELVGAMS